MKKIKFITGLAAIVLMFTSTAQINVPKAEEAFKPKCNCLLVYDPVCIIATGQQFSNACFAACAGFGPEDYTRCGDAVI